MNSDQLTTVKDNFVKELQEASQGNKTSLPFLVHEIPSSPLIKEGERFQVIVVGGSIFLRALLVKKGKNLHLIERESKGQKKFETREDFLSLIAKELDPSIQLLAINFAYPLSPLFEEGKLDGKLVTGMKENNFTGLVGKKVGSEIEAYVKEKTGRKITVSLANDTICLLLSGLTQVTTHDIAAGILGTGMNFAFFLDENHPVNLEAANFDKFIQSEEGKIIDSLSNAPGRALLEKETSGAYLYQHFNQIIKERGIRHRSLKATRELDELLDDPTARTYPITKMVLERSAGFIASVIAGITAYKGKNMTFVMEGSLFWNAKGYRRNVKKYLLQLIPEYSVTFIKIEDSPIFGAAKLIS